MEIIPVRYEDGLVCDMERVMKEHRYSTKTEFIREAVRDKIKDLEKEAALLRLQQAYGAGAKKGRKMQGEIVKDFASRRDWPRKIILPPGLKLCPSDGRHRDRRYSKPL